MPGANGPRLLLRFSVGAADSQRALHHINGAFLRIFGDRSPDFLPVSSLQVLRSVHDGNFDFFFRDGLHERAIQLQKIVFWNPGDSLLSLRDLPGAGVLVLSRSSGVWRALVLSGGQYLVAVLPSGRDGPRRNSFAF